MKKKYLYGALNSQLSIILFILLAAITYYIKLLKVNQLITYSFIFLILHLLLTKMYLSPKQIPYNCSIFLTFIINIIIINSFVLLNSHYNFIENFLNNKTYTTYNLIVLKKTTTYNTIDKLENKNIGSTTNNQIISTLKYNNVKYNDTEKLYEAIIKGDVQALIIPETEYQKIKDTNQYLQKTRSIKTISYVKE